MWSGLMGVKVGARAQAGLRRVKCEGSMDGVLVLCVEKSRWAMRADTH